jgi:glycerol-3-phosphate dehydrogenase (NAD(P)+)
VIEVLRRAAEHLRPGQPLLITTKGFGYDADGRVSLLPPLLRAVLPGGLRDACPIVAIGGPCKANEVAAGRPTAAVFGCADRSVADGAADMLSTDVYRIETTDDVDGVEASAAMKNVYAIALGVADGLADLGGEPWHDLKAAIFAQATTELQRIATALGGRAETAVGLAGVGDLEVTGLSGRNKVYGTRIGRGQAAKTALDEMVAANQTVEVSPPPGSLTSWPGSEPWTACRSWGRSRRCSQAPRSRPSASPTPSCRPSGNLPTPTPPGRRSGRVLGHGRRPPQWQRRR